ncbi:hypothetical protein A8F94_10320 [Bacillus sp. FJAT-27225]|uniref:phage holin family protein n=1 Tax=Bacillus sp. FJAT-27225 TaxID=1743144 RepID=UPI00080C324C|nr:phage holin family protein [Bacillus sp. FJAT-27225]OCA88194.1 hypothetical protein A8F94_10320 [Bacillus sp. FJAT-27225]
MKWLLGIAINAVLFMAIAGYFDDEFRLTGLGAAIGASFLLSVLNIIVRPILILLTLPVTILTLGLFLFVINALTLMLTDKLMGSAFEISSFGMAFLVAIIISLVNLVVQKVVFDKSKD